MVFFNVECGLFIAIHIMERLYYVKLYIIVLNKFLTNYKCDRKLIDSYMDQLTRAEEFAAVN